MIFLYTVEGTIACSMNMVGYVVDLLSYTRGDLLNKWWEGMLGGGD